MAGSRAFLRSEFEGVAAPPPPNRFLSRGLPLGPAPDIPLDFLVPEFPQEITAQTKISAENK